MMCVCSQTKNDACWVFMLHVALWTSIRMSQHFVASSSLNLIFTFTLASKTCFLWTCEKLKNPLLSYSRRISVLMGAAIDNEKDVL